MKVRITRLRPDVPLPRYQTPGSACFDLTCIENTIIAPGELKLLPLGLVIATPPGYMLMIASRSSTPMKKGLMLPHGIAIIDRDYCGPDDELLVLVRNFTERPVEIKKGDRICQAGFVRMDNAEWDEGPAATQESRGGHGSTGR
jgi:dUTP pyrophosphatase